VVDLASGMEIDFPYALSDEDARSRLEILGQYLVNRHGIRVTWVDQKTARFSGKYLVVKIDGELTLGNGQAQFRGEDPGFLWRKDRFLASVAGGIGLAVVMLSLATPRSRARGRYAAIPASL